MQNFGSKVQKSINFFSHCHFLLIPFSSQSLCFPGDDAVYVNPTSRLALIGKCTQWCDGGDISYEWSIMSNEFDIITVSTQCAVRD